MLKRLIGTGINISVLLISIAVFVISFFALNAIGEAQKPKTYKALAAARDMDIGHEIALGDVHEIVLFENESVQLYVPAEDIEAVVGQVVTLPMTKGQPLLKSAVAVADAGRLAAALKRYGSGSLFPLPLTAQNVVAPEALSIFPGDLLGITVVIGNRPQHPVATPEMYGAYPVIINTPAVIEPYPKVIEEEQNQNLYPPMSKDLFPDGVRVIAVQGVTRPVVEEEPAKKQTAAEVTSATYRGPDNPVLILLVPDDKRELLSLALNKGDLVLVSLLEKGSKEPTSGFTYWDFEQWFQVERGQKYPSILPTPTLTSTPSPEQITPTPTVFQ